MGQSSSLPPFHILVIIKKTLTGVLYFRGIHMAGSNNWNHILKLYITLTLGLFKHCSRQSC